MKKIFFCIPIILIILSCNKEVSKAEKVNKAFYYWKSADYYMGAPNDKILQDCKVNKLYVKLFEVAHSDIEGNIPISKSHLNIERGLAIVPCVYIKNEVFKKSTKEDLVKLADNVGYLIHKNLGGRQYKLANVLNEIQIDCDWTPSTKSHYFYFLKELKKVVRENVEISCTLRLYPYKYPNEMGVPPVDKAMLMCYNLINPFSNKDKNTILDIEELKKYLVKKKKYPLHLDVALPLYSWMQIYQNNAFTKITYQDFDIIKSASKPIDSLWYEVVKDTTAADMYLRIGDKVKYDKITIETVKEAITVIKENVALDKEITVSFFHLDDQQLKDFSNEEIANLYPLINK